MNSLDPHAIFWFIIKRKSILHNCELIEIIMMNAGSNYPNLFDRVIINFQKISHLKNYVIKQTIMVYEKLFSYQLMTILVTIPVFT